MALCVQRKTFKKGFCYPITTAFRGFYTTNYITNIKSTYGTLIIRAKQRAVKPLILERIFFVTVQDSHPQKILQYVPYGNIVKCLTLAVEINNRKSSVFMISRYCYLSHFLLSLFWTVQKSGVMNTIFKYQSYKVNKIE